MSQRPSPFDSLAGRQSPFRRQNSASPATVRAATPCSSPTKASSLSPTKTSATLSPEKTSPFVRRPSQINRPASPTARPSSSLSFPALPSRNISESSHNIEPLSPPTQFQTRDSTASPTPEGRDTRGLGPSSFDGARRSANEHPEDSSSFVPPSPANLRSTASRVITSSTTAAIKPPVFTTQPKASSAPKLNAIGGGAYNHIPQPLFHSMRESFEVLDSKNSGNVNSAAVSDMLSQMGLDNTPAALKDFFPHNGPAQMNLTRYLDVLSGPLAELSQSGELQAAFEAFDVDDSGQIDVSVLRDALLHTAPHPGEDMIRLSEREVDGILGEFTGRRAFGTKGLHASKAKGDVFRYRDFMASVNGGGVAGSGQEAPVMT